MNQAGILILEDDRDMGEVMSDVLIARGFPTTLTSTSQQALELLRTRHYGLLVMDLRLRGADGSSTLSELRQFSQLPVVVCSGEAGRWQPELLSLGAQACLQKPFPLDGFLSLVEAFSAVPLEASRFSRDIDAFTPLELHKLTQLSPLELDELPFSVAKLDGQGVLQAVNRVESEASDLSPRAVLGRDYFREVVPGLAGSALEQAIRDRSQATPLPPEPLDVRHQARLIRWGGLALVTVRAFAPANSPDCWIMLSLVPPRPVPGKPRESM